MTTPMYGETPDGGYYSVSENREHGGWQVSVWDKYSRGIGGRGPDAYYPARTLADALAIAARLGGAA